MLRPTLLALGLLALVAARVPDSFVVSDESYDVPDDFYEDEASSVDDGPESNPIPLWQQVRDLKKTMGVLSRQLMMQQFYVEEQARAELNSGIKRIRTTMQGTKPHFSPSHSDNRFAAIHNHANLDRTAGLGEFTAVLNGIHFQTRHNDYKLVMKSTTSDKYGETEPIPFPEIPPAVLQYTKVEDQIKEMREWFKAFKSQQWWNGRDYRPYFRAVLCYLEGSWTNSDQDSIDEDFDSDRHQLDAKSWLDLQEKARFTAYSGSKDNQENYAYLPTTVMRVVNESVPVLAQWNYRILCHPIKQNLPVNRIGLVDELKTRVNLRQNMEEYGLSRAARFRITSHDGGDFRQGRFKYDFVDKLMGEIAGANNYGSYIKDDAFGSTAFPFKPNPNNTQGLNLAYYNRHYRVQESGAMGVKLRHRGFNDEDLWVALTTQPKVPGLNVEKCNAQGKECKNYFQRWTYATPLEVIYLNPLSRWNPHDIEFKGMAWTPLGRTVKQGPQGPRNGQPTPTKAFNGTNHNTYYQTPVDFFGGESERDPADTAKDFTHVLDRSGTVRKVRASGIRVQLPHIPGVGALRQRYTVAAVAGEGGSAWKELSAVKDMVLYPKNYRKIFHQTPDCGCGGGGTPSPPQPEDERFSMGPATPEYGSHTHDVTLTPADIEDLKRDRTVTVTTGQGNTHNHILDVKRRWNGEGFEYFYQDCDGQTLCWDKHSRLLIPSA